MWACTVIMLSYGLNKALPTFVRATHVALEEMIDKTIGVYVDDILVKSLQKESFLADLVELFMSLKDHMHEARPAKCMFCQLREAHGAIKANLEKIQALLQMKHLRTKGDVQ